MNIENIAYFAAGVIAGEIGMLWVISMAKAAHDLPARQPSQGSANQATGNTGASTRASADGLPLSDYMRPKKAYGCMDCGKVQRVDTNPTTCTCGCGVFSIIGGPLTGAIIDHDRSASAIISPASAVISGPDSRDTSDKRTPRVS